jgi:hypothetical protein
MHVHSNPLLYPPAMAGTVLLTCPVSHSIHAGLLMEQASSNYSHYSILLDVSTHAHSAICTCLGLLLTDMLHHVMHHISDAPADHSGQLPHDSRQPHPHPQHQCPMPTCSHPAPLQPRCGSVPLPSPLPVHPMQGFAAPGTLCSRLAYLSVWHMVQDVGWRVVCMMWARRCPVRCLGMHASHFP